MPIAASDLINYLAASMPEDDVSTSGGAIATTGRPDLTQWTANAAAAVVSDGADTRTVTVTGRLASGVIDSEALVLNGASEVVGAKTWERVLKVVIGATDGSRTVTLRQGSGGATRATIGPNETTRRALFYASASEASQTIRYEKVFWRNNHGTLTLNAAKVTLTADPASRFEIGLAASKGDTGSVANRKTAPGGITFVDDGVEQSVPGGVLAASETIGVWLKQTLPADDAAQKTTVTTRLAGTTV